VLWPRGWRLAVVNHGGLPATLPYLADLSSSGSRVARIIGRR
jgi:hypothetical protein